jgi:hypothetical protein
MSASKQGKAAVADNLMRKPASRNSVRTFVPSSFDTSGSLSRTASTRPTRHPLLDWNCTARESLDLHSERKARPIHTSTNAIKVLPRDAEFARRFLTRHANLIQPARELGFALARSTYGPLRMMRHRDIVRKGAD